MGAFGNGDEQVSRRSRGKAASEGWDAAFVGYVNVDLTDEEKEGYDAWAESASFWEALEAFTTDGVHVTVKMEVKSGGFLASGTQRREKSPNAGLVVTARARTAGTALGRLLFTLTILSHYKRWEERQRVANPDRW